MDEIWKDIPQYKGYQASNLGRIRSVPRTTCHNHKLKGYVLRQRKNKSNGYMCVTLSIDGKRMMREVHRLVGLAFLQRKEGYTQINHKDEIKENNNAENLEWCTPSYNANYGSRIERCARSKRLGVNMYTMDMKRIRSFDSLAQAAEYVNGYQGNIAQNCKQYTKSAYGYVWHWQRATLAVDKHRNVYFKGKNTNKEE